MSARQRREGKTVFPPQAVALITIAGDRLGKTVEIAFLALQRSHQLNLVKLARRNTSYFCEFTYALYVHYQSSFSYTCHSAGHSVKAIHG